MASMLGRKGTVKDITHMFKTPGSGLPGPDKMRFDRIYGLIEKCTPDSSKAPTPEQFELLTQLLNEEPNHKVISQVVFALRRKMSMKQYRIAEYTLQIISHLVRNGTPPIQLSMGSNFFLMEFIRLIKKFHVKTTAALTTGEDRQKEKLLLTHMLEMITEWFVKYDKPGMRVHYGNFISAYYELVQEKIIVPNSSPKSTQEEFFSSDAAAPPLDSARTKVRSDSVEEEENQNYDSMDNQNYDSIDLIEQEFAKLETGIASLDFGNVRSFEPFLESDFNPKTSARTQNGFSIEVMDSARTDPGTYRRPQLPPKPSIDMNYMNGGEDSLHTTPQGTNGGYGKDVPSPHGSIMSDLTTDSFFKGPSLPNGPGGYSAGNYGNSSGYYGIGSLPPSHASYNANPTPSYYSSRPISQPVASVSATPVNPAVSLADRMSITITLLKDIILAASSRDELCRDECARDLSVELKSSHKELLALMETSSPTSNSILRPVHERVMECLWGYDSIIENKCAIGDVKATFRNSRLAQPPPAPAPPVSYSNANYGIGVSDRNPYGGSSISSHNSYAPSIPAPAPSPYNQMYAAPNASSPYSQMPNANYNSGGSLTSNYGNMASADYPSSRMSTAGSSVSGSGMYRGESFYKPPSSTISSPGGSPGPASWRNGNSGNSRYSVGGGSSYMSYNNSAYDDDVHSTASSAVYGGGSVASSHKQGSSGGYARPPSLPSDQKSTSNNPFDDYS